MDNQRIISLLERLNEGLFEKEHVMALSLLAAVAGESVFLLGPPGVAKSMVARRLKSAFRDGTSFEYLMSRFSTPDEIFGPVSIAALKDENRYRRVTTGYLPEADVVFLDEIWKAGPSIQNALLTVLNEKVFLNGNEEVRLPLKLVMAASNELPAEDENLGALWDRFLVRCVVDGIKSRELFNRMVSAPSGVDVEIPSGLQLTEEELALWDEGIGRVEIPPFVFAFIHALRSRIVAYNATATDKGEHIFYVSDRRWKKIVHLWRTSAFLNGRSAVSLSDVLLLSACLWDEPGQEAPLSGLITEALAEACKEHLGLPLLAERMGAVREMGVEEVPRPAFKVVRSFFYQVKHAAGSLPVLIYTTEYDALSDTSPTDFVLTVDRRKTGAQILRRYLKAQHAGTPSDKLLPVVRTATGFTVNGRAYELLPDAETPQASEAGEDSRSRSGVSAEVVKRIIAEVETCSARAEQWMRDETELAASNIFLDDGQRACLARSGRMLTAGISSLLIDSQELAHAFARK